MRTLRLNTRKAQRMWRAKGKPQGIPFRAWARQRFANKERAQMSDKLLRIVTGPLG